MASAQVWRQRVQDWKTSGKGAEDFCEGREFSAGLLRHWAWRLGLTSRRKRKSGAQPGTSVPLARVVVARSLEHAPAQAAAEGSEIEVDVGGARVRVRAGFDPELLTAVLDVLDGRVARIKEQRR